MSLRKKDRFVHFFNIYTTRQVGVEILMHPTVTIADARMFLNCQCMAENTDQGAYVFGQHSKPAKKTITDTSIKNPHEPKLVAALERGYGVYVATAHATYYHCQQNKLHCGIYFVLPCKLLGEATRKNSRLDNPSQQRMLGHHLVVSRTVLLTIIFGTRLTLQMFQPHSLTDNFGTGLTLQMVQPHRQQLKLFSIRAENSNQIALVKRNHLFTSLRMQRICRRTSSCIFEFLSHQHWPFRSANCQSKRKKT